MFKKVNVRVQNEIYEELRQQALRDGISISDVVREKILQQENINQSQDQDSSASLSLQTQLSEILSLVSKNEKNKHEADPTLIEILFLLRELFLQRDGGVIRKVDAKLDQLFGKERRKIL